MVADRKWFCIVWCVVKTIPWVGLFFMGLTCIVLAVAILFKACDAHASEPVRKRVAFIGDSITTGKYPVIVYDLLVQRCDKWWDVFSYSRLAKKGASIKAVQEDFNSTLSKDEEFKPSYIVLYGGLNDCLRGKNRPAKRVIRRLREMVDAAHDAKIELVILKLHVRSKCSAKVNKWLDGVKKAQVVDTLGLRKKVKRNERMISGDGIHLTCWGNYVLAGMVYEQVDWGC